MLYWSKYIVKDLIDKVLILWSTINSDGIVITNNYTEVLNSLKSGKNNDELSIRLTEKLKSKGFLLTEEQYNLESKLVKGIRNQTVYDEGFMSLTIIPTSICNFNCIYCYQDAPYHFMSRDIASAIIKMIKQKRELVKLHISWFGGEPLCNKELVFALMGDINNVCKEKGITLIGDMTTNGSLLDLVTFNKLYSLKVANYQITIDGCRRTHDIQRPYKDGRGSFDNIMKNLYDIRDNAKGKFFKIGIRTNFTGLVDAEFNEFYHTLVDEFSGDRRFYFFFQWVKNWGGNKITKIQKELLDDHDSIQKYGNWMDMMSLTNVKTGDISLIRACSGLCIACRKNSFLIDTDGSICKCTTGLYDGLMSKVKIGYINESGIIIKDKWKEIEWLSCDTDTDKCENCNIFPICLGMPCPLHKLKHGETLCRQDDTYVKYILRAMARQGYIESI